MELLMCFIISVDICSMVLGSCRANSLPDDG